MAPPILSLLQWETVDGLYRKVESSQRHMTYFNELTPTQTTQVSDIVRPSTVYALRGCKLIVEIMVQWGKTIALIPFKIFKGCRPVPPTPGRETHMGTPRRAASATWNPQCEEGEERG